MLAPDVAGAKKADANLDQSNCKLRKLLDGALFTPLPAAVRLSLAYCALYLTRHRINKPLDPTSRPLDTDPERRHHFYRSASSRSRPRKLAHCLHTRLA